MTGRYASGRPVPEDHHYIHYVGICPICGTAKGYLKRQPGWRGGPREYVALSPAESYDFCMENQRAAAPVSDAIAALDALYLGEAA